MTEPTTKRPRTIAPRVLQSSYKDGWQDVLAPNELNDAVTNAPSTSVAVSRVKKAVSDGTLAPGTYRLIYVSKVFTVTKEEQKKVVTRIEE